MRVPGEEMEGQSNLFENELKPPKKLSTRQNIVRLVFACMVAGISLYGVVPKKQARLDFFGKVLTKEEFRQNLILAIAFSYPVLAFAAGLLLSLLPYKNLRYKDKYLPFSLVTLFVLYVLIILGVLFSLLKS